MVFLGSHLLALTVTVPHTVCWGHTRARARRQLPARGRVLRVVVRARWSGRGLSAEGGRPGAQRSPRMPLAGPAMAAPGEQLRRRKAADAGQEPASPPGPGHDPAGCPARLRAGTFWLTRIVLLRALAFIYCESAGPGRRRYRSSARARDSRQ